MLVLADMIVMLDKFLFWHFSSMPGTANNVSLIM